MLRLTLFALLAACHEPAAVDTITLDASPDAVVEHRVRDAVAALQPPAGTDWSLTFEDLQTGERVAIAGDAKHVSASSAKAWWVAAALDKTSISAVTPYATPIFQYSDNSAAGSVIDLVGVNEMNVWMWDVAGMTNSALTQWSFDKTRIATNSPRALGDDNYMTSDDAVTFLSRVYRKQIIAGSAEQFMAWMTLSPNNGLGGWIPAQLPDAVAMTAMHKAGWLPPGCCSDDGYYNTSNDIGLVTVDGHAYAIAILARRGPDYDAQTAFVERASCVVYKAFADDESLVCD